MKKSTTIFDFFKIKVSNDLEANTSGAILPTTNIEENPNEPVEENLNVPIEQNSQTKFQKVDMSSLQLELDPGLHRQIILYIFLC